MLWARRPGVWIPEGQVIFVLHDCSDWHIGLANLFNLLRGSLRWVKAGRSVSFTTHLHLVSRLWMSGSIPLLPPPHPPFLHFINSLRRVCLLFWETFTGCLWNMRVAFSQYDVKITMHLSELQLHLYQTSRRHIGKGHTPRNFHPQNFKSLKVIQVCDLWTLFLAYCCQLVQSAVIMPHL